MKRDEIKYIRDISKSAYKKDTECAICGTSKLLEFHHYYGMTALWNKYKKDNSIVIRTEADILEVREDFKRAHIQEIYNEAVTLCKEHHARLHKIYGKAPMLHTAEKQKNWVLIQRNKLRG